MDMFPSAFFFFLPILPGSELPGRGVEPFVI